LASAGFELTIVADPSALGKIQTAGIGCTAAAVAVVAVLAGVVPAVCPSTVALKQNRTIAAASNTIAFPFIISSS
jgi:hypothetical protein